MNGNDLLLVNAQALPLPRIPFKLTKPLQRVLNQISFYNQIPIKETMKISNELNIIHLGTNQEAADYDGNVPAKTMSTDYVVRYKMNS